MRFGAVSTITFLSAVALVACIPGSPSTKVSGEGGDSNGGATSGSGGVTPVGGKVASGGATAAGGARATGGSSSATGTGGGTAGSGGTNPTAGNTAIGGAAGGAGAAGSNSPSGGASGSCTDDPPPQTPTCADWAAWNTCGADWFKTYCNKSCGRCSGPGPGGTGGATSRGGAAGGVGAGGAAGGSGTSGGGGVPGPGTTNPQITGSNGFATRYWDCCKPSCSWTTSVPSCQKDGLTRITDRNAQSACSNGSAYECYDFSPWYDSSTNLSYGFVAHNGSCGTCYMLQFTGEGHSGKNAGATALKGQQMIVQAINIGNIAGDQFDVLIPGGGVGDFDACSKQFGFSSNTRYGGLLSDCNGDPNCMKQKCQTVFGNIPALLAGCNWFTGWYSSADNPNVVYKQVPCPSQITSKSGFGG